MQFIAVVEEKQAAIFADKLMRCGFSHACRAGISIGKDDFVIPEAKKSLVEEAHAQAKEYEQQYQDGLITQGEKYNKVIDVWSHCTEQVADKMMDSIADTEKRAQDVNSVYMMAHSGARGAPAQIKQLSGMRGLMAKPSGEIIETPIVSNFKEGLTVLEYFNSTHGARKGLADTALKTANSGYLTRRLVDVAQDCIVYDDNCGTTEGVSLSSVIEGGEVVAPLEERILGRCAAEDIADPATGEIVVPRDSLIDEGLALRIAHIGIDKVKIRSVLMCENKTGVCAHCYGRDLARGSLINIGEAVGVVAAQSIGEPGTQLTMRTFHIGGAVQRGAELSGVEAAFDARIGFRNIASVRAADGRLVVIGRNTELLLLDSSGIERGRHRIPYGARLMVEEGAQVNKGDHLADWNPYAIPIITERSGIVCYEDLVEGIAIKEVLDESTGIASKVVTDWKQQARGVDLKPCVVLKDNNGDIVLLKSGSEARYFLSVEAVLAVDDGQKVHEGDILARIPREFSKARDITGGLPRVAELFEARKPKDLAVIADIAGRIEFGRDYKAKRRVLIVPDGENSEPVEYLLPKGRHLSVQEGDYVEKGDILIDGNPAPHDILRILGVETLAHYLIHEIQSVYRLQGVKIDDKHIEVIIRQMLQKVEITDPGDAAFLNGEHISLIDFQKENEKLLAEGKRAACGFRVLQGITKASLQTNSFVSAASFQETTRVLTDAAVNSRIDYLEGLKENVIVGRLIPAGTGSVVRRMRMLAAARDQSSLLGGETQSQAEDNLVPSHVKG